MDGALEVASSKVKQQSICFLQISCCKSKADTRTWMLSSEEARAETFTQQMKLTQRVGGGWGGAEVLVVEER